VTENRPSPEMTQSRTAAPPGPFQPALWRLAVLSRLRAGLHILLGHGPSDAPDEGGVTDCAPPCPRLLLPIASRSVSGSCPVTVAYAEC
jgi:hypothetical protein